MNFEPAVATGLKRIKMEEDKTLLSYITMAEAYLNNQPVQTAPTPGFLTYMRVAVVLTGRRDCMERWVHSEVRVAMQQLGIVDYRHYDTNDLCADNLELVDKIKRRVVSWPPKLEIDAEGRAHLPPRSGHHLVLDAWVLPTSRVTIHVRVAPLALRLALGIGDRVVCRTASVGNSSTVRIGHPPIDDAEIATTETFSTGTARHSFAKGNHGFSEPSPVSASAHRDLRSGGRIQATESRHAVCDGDVSGARGDVHR